MFCWLTSQSPQLTTVCLGCRHRMSWIEDPGWEKFRGLNRSDLEVDEAYVNVTSRIDIPLWLYTLSEECYKVSF
jgi:hypothetical protein